MTCCHYDDGYEDGHRDAEDEDAIGDVLEAAAHRYEIAGDWEKAHYTRLIAHDLAKQNTQRMLEDERKRQGELVGLYRKERAA